MSGWGWRPSNTSLWLMLELLLFLSELHTNTNVLIFAFPNRLAPLASFLSLTCFRLTILNSPPSSFKHPSSSILWPLSWPTSKNGSVLRPVKHPTSAGVWLKSICLKLTKYSILLGSFSSNQHLRNLKVCKWQSFVMDFGNALIFVGETSRYLKCFSLQIESGSSVI